MEPEMKAKPSPELTDHQHKEKSYTHITNGLINKGKNHPRLEQLRGQIKMQIREHSPRNQIRELVDKMTLEHVVTKAQSKDNGAEESSRVNHCCSPTCFASELEGKLQAELSALRLEVKSSLEAMRTELGQELRALHRDVKVCCHHCPSKDSDYSTAAEKRAEWRNVFRKVKSKEEPDVRTPVRLEGQIKARSVPSLALPTGPSRNQVLLRAMSTISAKNALMSSIGARSDSDPGQLPHGKQNNKPALKTQESTDHGNCGKKISNRIVVPLPQSGVPVAKGH
ncbi:hypothetical protein XELAEV_18010513mg [Xenopus laevis]|uniref:Uncharacterized protein n=1 Tax=Xenopus laevis TaxID=8355 RepID=A0A974I1T7_XENLA|nr:hypothetical protein XELAEV_18010513mg [Xenopus laevis]